MDIGFVVRGLLIGLAIAAPVGPIGLLCIRRTLTDGRLYGFVTGMGAATADMIYGGVAAFGLTAVSAVLVSQQTWLRLIGGAALCYVGLRTFLSHPATETTQSAQSKAEVSARGLIAAYFSTLGLTLTNPATIISFAAVFAGLGATRADGAALTVLGVFLGSALWWLLLSGGLSLIRNRVSVTGLRWLNRLSGLCLIAFGGAAIASIVL